jgi:DNA (cytosine-5)-methyltransferase 1
MGLSFGSVCSGIEAASVAWHPLGWRAAFVSEIEAFPRAVLQHRWPETPLHGDFTTIQQGDYEPIDLLVGGTPCQSFSVAGLRGGLDDERGNLALEYLRLADRLRPRWLVWENVPGVLSSNGGRDFGSILGGLVELGYGFAYRVLDAQFFGVAQRRRRVFVVGHLGDWRRAAAVLFERHSLQGHPAPRREKGQSSPTIPSRSSAGGGLGTDFDCDGGLIQAFGGNNTSGPVEVAAALAALAAHGGPMGRMDFASETFIAHTVATLDASYGRLQGASGQDANHGHSHLVPTTFSIMPMNSGKDYKAREVEVAQPVMAGGPVGGNQGGDYIVQPAIAFALRGREGGAMPEISDGVSALRSASGGSSRDYVAFAQNQRDEVRMMSVAGALAAEPGAKQQTYAHLGSAVRRLTPRECERLQGFPDDYTAIPYRGKLAADGPRYKALGNSMAVPVMAWIGRRIEAVEALQLAESAAA